MGYVAQFHDPDGNLPQSRTDARYAKKEPTDDAEARIEALAKKTVG